MTDDPKTIALGLSEPQRAILLAGANGEVGGGIGAWFLLRNAGFLDHNFNMTLLGVQVRAALTIDAPECRCFNCGEYASDCRCDGGIP